MDALSLLNPVLQKFDTAAPLSGGGTREWHLTVKLCDFHFLFAVSLFQ